MDNSESQFDELLAHLSARVSKALSAGEQLLLALLLRADGKVDVVVGIANTPGEFKEVLNSMQDSLKVQIADESIEAVCIAYPDGSNDTFVAWLENRENYCAKVIIPVVMVPTPGLDLENLEVEDGGIHVFPYIDGA